MHNLQRTPMNSYQQPDASGHFGSYGGSFVSETLTHAIQELRDAYARYQNDPRRSPHIDNVRDEALAHYSGQLTLAQDLQRYHLGRNGLLEASA